MRAALFWDFTQRRMVVCYRRRRKRRRWYHVSLSYCTCNVLTKYLIISFNQLRAGLVYNTANYNKGIRGRACPIERNGDDSRLQLANFLSRFNVILSRSFGRCASNCALCRPALPISWTSYSLGPLQKSKCVRK